VQLLADLSLVGFRRTIILGRCGEEIGVQRVFKGSCSVTIISRLRGHAELSKLASQKIAANCKISRKLSGYPNLSSAMKYTDGQPGSARRS
jgi:hypothetical protein